MLEKKYQEIEMKFKLNNSKDVLIILKSLGAEKVVDQEYQCDIYYAPSHRNFFEEEIISEWLRLRRTTSKEHLNYKRWLPIGEKIQTHCEEYETEVSDGFALIKILEYMDFKEEEDMFKIGINKYFEEETEQYNEYRKNTLLFNRKPIYPKFKLNHLVNSVSKYK